MAINATLNLFISQSLRPSSERFRANYYQGIDLSARATAEIVPVMVSTGLATFDASSGLTPVSRGHHASYKRGVLQTGEFVYVDHCKHCSRSGSRRCNVQRLRATNHGELTWQ